LRKNKRKKVFVENEYITDIKFATNGCQDTVVVGSMFSETLKSNTTAYADVAIEKLQTKLGILTQQQKICADLVLAAFSAALVNFANRSKGIDEELHLLKTQESCEIDIGNKDA
jgi:nitrogen fixation NifU-like protein